MKKTVLLLLACLGTGPVSGAEASKAPTFEMRLVLDKPTVDSEKMKLPRRTGAGGGADYETIYVRKISLIDHTSLKSASVMKDPLSGKSENIEITFTDEGKERFAKVTRENIGKRLAILIESKPVSAPKINDEVSGGKAVISGIFSEKDARELAARINSALVR